MLVLARRLKAVTERVNLFLPASEGRLPHPGTPVPEFTATSISGAPVGHADLDAGEHIVALLTTDCASCRDQVPALRELDSQPLVVVIGPPEQRAGMVAPLAGRAVVVEEPDHGPIAEAFEVEEFPAVLLVRDGVVRAAGHGLAGVLETAAAPARA